MWVSALAETAVSRTRRRIPKWHARGKRSSDRTRRTSGSTAASRSTGRTAVDAGGGEVPGRRLENRQADVDALLAEAGGDALVVVDQKNNIGSLVVRRCREAGVDVGYMTGLTMKKARDMWPGTAKTDRIDAEVIARTAMGMRQVVLPIAETDDLGASLSLMSPQLEYATRCATQARNRLHAVLLESDPAFEAAVDLSCAWQLAVLARLGGASGISGAGRRSYSATCANAGAKASSRDALWEAAESSARDGFHPAAEDALVRGLASQIGSLDAQRRELEASIARELAGDETYACLLTVPGIGPKTATTLATMVDVSLFAGDDRLASYCGLAPADRQSGTSISSTSASRSGNKTLKNLLIFSCNSLVGTRNRFGRYYDECRARGMAHNKALKAVARKRLGVIFAIMRDKVPYVEPGDECSKPDT
ncbi:MAG: IS110 family transposase [Atopobiaceae bacterium]|nr:IS110 family transposase [Atopobiaceae bacterium]